MLELLAYLVVGLGAIGAFLLTLLGMAIVVALNKMVTDELRARIDDIPAALVELALLAAPPSDRDHLRVDWVDNLLVAFDAKNARYPLSRLYRSAEFVFPLFGTSITLRTQARSVRRKAEQDERNERLLGPELDVIDAIITDPANPISGSFRTKVYIQAKVWESNELTREQIDKLPVYYKPSRVTLSDK